MINSANNSGIASRFENQADLDSNAKRRAKAASARTSTEAQSAWIKRATGVMTFGLLAAEGAYGRALLPPKNTLTGFAGHARALMQDCTAAAPAVGTANTTWLQSAGPYVNAVAGSQSWVPQEDNACPPPYAVDLAYVFDTSGDTILGSPVTDVDTLDDATQATLAHDFAQITGFVGLTFTPYDNATGDWPNLSILRNTDANTTIKHWYAEAPGYVDGVMSRVVYTEPAGNGSTVERLAGLSYALGLKGIGTASVAGSGLPVGNFGDTALSSVTASVDNACWPASRLGPLDLAFLAARHGLAPLLSQVETIELDASFGTGGLLLSPDGVTTLAAVHPGQVTISLRDDGSSATSIGASVILLAPGSVAAGADASAAQGAWLIGNDADNSLVGSAFDDFFSPGANASVITLGLGADSVLLDDTVASNISLEDFDPLTDSIWVTPNAAASGQPATQITLGDSADGATVLTPGGISVSLRNLTSADLPEPTGWIFSGVPDTLDAFRIDLCQGIANAPVPAPGPAALLPSLTPAPVPAAVSGVAPAPAPAAVSGVAPTPATPLATPPTAALAPDVVAAAPTGLPATATPQSDHHGHANGGAIAGGVVGGIAGLGVLGTLAWCFSRRRRTAGSRFQRFEGAGAQNVVELTGVPPAPDFGR